MWLDERARGDLVRSLRDAGCVFAEDEAALLLAAATSRAELDGMATRRAAGWPLEYIVGWAQFCGRRIAVAPGVFVPRVRTELLVAEAEALASPAPVVLDLCCGTGAVGVVLSERLSRVELHAVDIDPAAVQCAARNIGSRGTVYQGDLYEPLPSSLAGRFTLIVANAPYVPSGEVSRLPREARLYEPQASLDGGVDGLDIQRRVAAGAYTWLASGGHLLIETSWHQAERTRGVVAAAHLSADVVRSEALEAAVVVGTKRAMRLA